MHFTVAAAPSATDTSPARRVRSLSRDILLSKKCKSGVTTHIPLTARSEQVPEPSRLLRGRRPTATL